GRRRIERLLDPREQLGEGAVQACLEGFRVLELAAREARAQLLQDALGRVDADVREHEPGLELLQHLLVDLPAGYELRDVGAEPAAAAVQARAQPLDEAFPRGGRFLGLFLVLTPEHDESAAGPIPWKRANGR